MAYPGCGGYGAFEPICCGYALTGGFGLFAASW